MARAQDVWKSRMNMSWHASLIKPRRRMTRVLVILVVMPALMVGSLTVEAIVIHDHHGHDVHSHSLKLSQLDDLRSDAEHQHEEHEHDGRPVDPPADDGCTIVIVLDLPEALPGVRGMSTSTVVATGFRPSPSPVAVAAAAGANDHPPYTCASSSAPNLRAGSTVLGILLSNHALLL